MVQRLRELLDKEDQDHQGLKKTEKPPDSLPPEEEAAEKAEVQSPRKEEESSRERPVFNARSRPSFQLGLAQKTSSRVAGSVKPTPEPLYLAATPELSLGEAEARPASTGVLGKRKAPLRENGRKAKQKLNFLSEPEAEAEAGAGAGAGAGPDFGQEQERSASEQLVNSSWSEMSSWVIGNNYRLFPLTPAMEQRLILQYLTPLGDYQEVRPTPHHVGHLDPDMRTPRPRLRGPEVLWGHRLLVTVPYGPYKLVILFFSHCFPVAAGCLHAVGHQRTAHALH